LALRAARFVGPAGFPGGDRGRPVGARYRRRSRRRHLVERNVSFNNDAGLPARAFTAQINALQH
jgi:hypothetical protein